MNHYNIHKMREFLTEHHIQIVYDQGESIIAVQCCIFHFPIYSFRPTIIIYGLLARKYLMHLDGSYIISMSFIKSIIHESIQLLHYNLHDFLMSHYYLLIFLSLITSYSLPFLALNFRVCPALAGPVILQVPHASGLLVHVFLCFNVLVSCVYINLIITVSPFQVYKAKHKNIIHTHSLTLESAGHPLPHEMSYLVRVIYARMRLTVRYRLRIIMCMYAHIEGILGAYNILLKLRPRSSYCGRFGIELSGEQQHYSTSYY